ncbi:MAG: replication initiator protein [Arizlama microvirus]|nr:MAG: replication initiator protein [Arizlama microvirus]
MPCYHPLSAWQLLNVKTAKGKPTISFKNPYAKPSATRVGIQVPCGQCIGCRLERSRQWAIRCVHEAYGHEDNAFITLTYAPEHLPPDVSLNKSHFQKFMKRLRKAISPLLVRFFHCGEYGEINQRPHYHACLFGYSFPDKVLYAIRDECRLYMSPMLQKLWPYGFSTVGDVTFESAAYVARYITKKITGDLAEKHYNGRLPEYTTMSRRPGIGKNWYDKYSSDVYPSDEVVLRGKILTPPRFYDQQLEKENLELYTKIKLDRKAQAILNSADNTTKRLAVKEQCKIAQFKLLKRGLESNE